MGLQRLLEVVEQRSETEGVPGDEVTGGRLLLPPSCGGDEERPPTEKPTTRRMGQAKGTSGAAPDAPAARDRAQAKVSFSGHSFARGRALSPSPASLSWSRGLATVAARVLAPEFESLPEPEVVTPLSDTLSVRRERCRGTLEGEGREQPDVEVVADTGSAPDSSLCGLSSVASSGSRVRTLAVWGSHTAC